MDEIDYNFKLSSNNPSIIALTISKICDVIKEKYKENETSVSANSTISINDIPELKFLKHKCGINNKLIALTAGQGISYLVEKEVLPLRATLAELVSLLPHIRCYSGIITAICKILILEVKHSENSSTIYTCNYKLLSPQHPLITILLHDYNTWLEVFQNIKIHFLQHDGSIPGNHYNLFKSIFFFVMCAPDSKIPVLSQTEIWNFLIHLNDKYSRNIVLNEILPWLPIHSTLCAFKVSHVIALAECAIDNHDNELLYSLVLSLTSCIYNLNKVNEDPKDCIECILECIEVLGDDFPFEFSLFLLSEALYVVPSIYLEHLLYLCKTMIKKTQINIFPLMSLKAVVLHWLMFSCTLTNSSKDIILEILSISNDVIELKQNSKYQIIPLLPYSDKDISLTLKLISLIKHWNGNQDLMLKWLKNVSCAPLYFLKSLFNFLSGIFIWQNARITIISETLQTLIKIISFDSNLSSQLLTLILYKLSNEKRPELQLILLNTLPKLTNLPQNLPLIIHTIHSLSNGPEILKMHSMKLLFDLWIIEPKCYTYLQKILLWKPDPLKASEFYILKANILKEICYKRPEVYGTEMVGHLSEILNRCSTNAGALASSFALKGIMHLCKASIIDLPSTWNAIAPKFKTDTRPGVIISLCDFFAEIPECYVTPEKTDILDREVIDKLWDLFGIAEDEHVLFAVSNALGKFNNEKIREQAPARYLDENGKFFDDGWLKVIEYSVSSYKAAGNLMVSLIGNEIREFRGGVYLIPEGRREPTDYNYLPQNSVLRAIGNYVLQQAGKLKDPSENAVFVQCLRILSKAYSKPLPPLDWCFLQEFVHFSTLRHCILSIASHQILLSGTARRLIDNFIADQKPSLESIDDVMIIFSCLKYLCNGIQPTTLQPFIKTSLTLGLENIEYGSDMLKYVKETMADKDVHLANKSGIADILKTLIEDTSIDSALFPLLVECIMYVEDEFIYLVNAPKDKNERLSKLYSFEKTVKIRTKMVETKLNFKYFNHCVDSAANENERKCVENHLMLLLKEEKYFKLLQNWISELMSKIQTATAEDDKSVTKLIFLCDLYIISIIILSGTSHIITSGNIAKSEERLDVFPFGIITMLKVAEFHCQVSQVIEWLHYMVNYKQIPINYRSTFYKCLVALKYENKFQEKWTKYTIIECPTNT